MSEKKQDNLCLTVGPEDSVFFGQATMSGIQHVLIMDAYVVLVVTASIVRINAARTSSLIQAAFITAGLTTIIQSHFRMKLPAAQGPSFIPIRAIAGIYFTNNQQGSGWNVILGVNLVGTIVVIILGFTGVPDRLITKFAPPVVKRTIISVVGLSLVSIVLSDNICHTKRGSERDILLASITARMLVFFALLGPALKKGRILRVSSIILTLLFGSIAAQLLGVLDLLAVSKAAQFSLPQLPLVNFFFQFDWPAIATMLTICLALMAETTDTWLAMSHVVAEPLTEKKVNHDIIGEGLGCLVSSFIGGAPVTSYSTDAGIISIIGIASRKASVVTDAWFVLFGLFGGLSALISAIPAPVISGVFMVVRSTISVNGMKVMSDVTIHEEGIYVIAAPVIMALALTLLPKEFLGTLPRFLQYSFSSPVAAASIVTILLQAILPNIQGG